jgi:predicted NBD/HSP70 family sugar kinase
VPVRHTLEEQSGLPVVTDSSVRAIANAEAWFGVHRKVRPLVVVLVGNVVAAATVSRRSTLLGADFTEGQIGHLTVGGSRPCVCGRVGCLEAEVRTDAFMESARVRGIRTSGDLTPDLVIEEASRGNRSALELLRERGRMIAQGIAVMDAVVNPQVVLLTGSGFGRGDDLQIAFAREGLRDYLVLPHVRSAPRLAPGSFGAASGPMGAASLALRKIYEDAEGSLAG